MDKPESDNIDGSVFANEISEQEKNNANDGGFIQENEIPEITPEKKNSIKKTIAISVVLVMCVIGSILAYYIYDASIPTYTQVDHSLPHDCYLTLFYEKDEYDKLRMSCNPDKFYNGEMMEDVRKAIIVILDLKGIPHGNVTINLPEVPGENNE